MDTFSKRINKSEKAFYSASERINLKSGQRSLIPNTTQLIFPQQQVATSHLPNPPTKSKNFPVSLASRDYDAQLPPNPQYYF